jgi:DamX protein
MAGNDTLTYLMNKPLTGQKNRGLQSLITQERTRKLELLIHLLTNSRQTLVVCGPEGIGKSTFLTVLQQRKIDSWLYCPVKGTVKLSIETIQKQLIQAIKSDNLPNLTLNALSGAFRELEKQHKKIILMIDEAGKLAPGLINTIIDYAVNNPVLRLVFVLTNDELETKYSSDNALDAGYLIEIPPLSEQQCGHFLQHLATKFRTPIAFNEIDDTLIAAVYLETQGIPGLMVDKRPSLDEAISGNHSLGILVVAVLGLIALALGTQWFSSSEYNLKRTTAPVVEQSVGSDSGETQ